jgi:ATP-binding cassette, subfamily B, bacterial
MRRSRDNDMKRRRARTAARLANAVQARRPVLEFLRLFPQASRSGTVGLAAQVVAVGLLPLAVMLATGALVAAVSDERSPLPGITSPWVALGMVGALFVLVQVVLPFLAPVADRLAYRLDLLLHQRMLHAVLTPPTLAHLEEPELADELTQARTVGTEQVQTTQAVAALSAIGSARLMATSSAVVLLSYRWWAPLLLIGAWMVANDWYRQETARLISSLEGSTAGFRRARYLSDLALSGAAAKELRLFGLARWLAARFNVYWRAGVDEVWSHPGRHRWALLASAVALIGGHGLVLGLLVRSALRGELGLGQLTIYIQAMLSMAGFGWDANSQYVLRLGTAPLPHALRVCEAADSPQFRLPGSKPPPAAPQNGIRFQAVSFAYPKTDREVLRELDLWLPAKRSLAIVGDNGSGKTTLLKLLCRFYDPTQGLVTVDGVDLREFDAAAWQRRIAAVFQDFAHYPLSAHDNVTFGNVARRDDREALQRAATAAGVADIIERLPAGWDTPLSRQFPSGTDPSGGQWQRVALARVLFAVEGGASILVLDEPTANLDIRAEADFYDRFLDLTRGLTTVVVSHRFSTVRHADRIMVLDRGQVVEAGSHDELMSLGGRYAAMFTVQAAAYRESSRA